MPLEPAMQEAMGEMVDSDLLQSALPGDQVSPGRLDPDRLAAVAGSRGVGVMIREIPA